MHDSHYFPLKLSPSGQQQMWVIFASVIYLGTSDQELRLDLKNMASKEKQPFSVKPTWDHHNSGKGLYWYKEWCFSSSCKKTKTQSHHTSCCHTCLQFTLIWCTFVQTTRNTVHSKSSFCLSFWWNYYSFYRRHANQNKSTIEKCVQELAAMHCQDIWRVISVLFFMQGWDGNKQNKEKIKKQSQQIIGLIKVWTGVISCNISLVIKWNLLSGSFVEKLSGSLVKNIFTSEFN